MSRVNSPERLTIAQISEPRLSVGHEQKINMPPEEQKKYIENEQLADEWQGCCSRTNKHYLKYIIQVGMGCGIIAFSMIQIAREAPNKEIYFSLISGTVGIFLPNPQITSAP